MSSLLILIRNNFLNRKSQELLFFLKQTRKKCDFKDFYIHLPNLISNGRTFFRYLKTGSWGEKVFENRILRQIYGPKRDENVKWRRLHNEELHSFYRSPNIFRVIKSRRLRWAGHVARMEEGRSAFKVFTDRPTGKIPLGWPRRRWEENIRMNLE